jgi:hypothetical protein
VSDNVEKRFETDIRTFFVYYESSDSHFFIAYLFFSIFVLFIADFVAGGRSVLSES